MSVYIYEYIYTHAYIHTYIHTYILIYIHTNLNIRVCVGVSESNAAQGGKK